MPPPSPLPDPGARRALPRAALLAGQVGLVMAITMAASRGAGAAPMNSAPPPAGSAPAAPAQEPPLPQIARDGWKDCAYNGETIGCRDEQLDDGLRILWKDGLRMTYRARPAQRPGEPVHLVDRYGGLWRRELLVQGNTLLTNLRSGNRILVPLRLVCRPPLRGEVGYCHR